MFFSFSSSAKGQITQTTPLIEVRQEKTKEFQTQLLHYFSKSDNKSNHHHHCPCLTSLQSVLSVGEEPRLEYQDSTVLLF